MPERVQLSRAKGWKMPANTVKVDRSTRWGNPNLVITHGYAGAVRRFEAELRAGILRFSIDDVRRELRGKNLACWCKPGVRCHADVLLRVANETTTDPSAYRSPNGPQADHFRDTAMMIPAEKRRYSPDSPPRLRKPGESIEAYQVAMGWAENGL